MLQERFELAENIRSKVKEQNQNHCLKELKYKSEKQIDFNLKLLNFIAGLEFCYVSEITGSLQVKLKQSFFLTLSMLISEEYITRLS